MIYAVQYRLGQDGHGSKMYDGNAGLPKVTKTVKITVKTLYGSGLGNVGFQEIEMHGKYFLQHILNTICFT